MNVDGIELYHVSMPLTSPFRTAYGEDSSIQSVLVKIESGDESGWGEATPFEAPCYSPEWAGGVFELTKRYLAPRIIGQDIRTPEELTHCLSSFKGNFFAKAGIEMAWWVLKAKLEKKPLHRLLGGRSEPVQVGADFGVQTSINTLLEKIQDALDEGYPRVKLKFRRGWDINMLTAVRDQFPDTVFHIDCNAGFSLSDVDLFRRVDRFELAMIEQPLRYDDLLDHAKLQKVIETPICLDESITSPETAGHAIELDSCRYINIKIGRVGGLLNAVKIHDMCNDVGLPCWVGGMLESAVGSGISVELATLPNFRYPADIFSSKTFYQEDLANPEIQLCAPGKIAPSNVPGIPYAPRNDRLWLSTIGKISLISTKK